MNFDDRLATVLATPVTSDHDRAVRWRQLVDLVARAGPDANSPQIDQAIAAIRSGQPAVPAAVRAATARAIGALSLPALLIEAFAADTVDVAAPLLATAAPSEALRAAASPGVRRFLDALHAPPAEFGEGDAPAPTVPPAPPGGSPLVIPTITEVVARIEQLRTARALAAKREEPLELAAPEPAEPAETPEPEPAPVVAEATPAPAATTSAATRDPLVSIAPRSLPADGSPALFRWECGAGGTIGWVEGAPRAPLIGRSIADAGATLAAGEVARSFARRAPFRESPLTLTDGGVVEGDWLVSGKPAFAPDDGRFVGYRGIARRADALAPAGPGGDERLEGSSLRELVHEMKTPLNAILGFAQIIEGQYLGPAHSGYRARAAEIVGQADLLLAAIDDLDFAGKLEPGEHRADLADLFARLALRLHDAARDRGVSLAVDAAPLDGALAMDEQLAERLIERFVTAVLAAAVDGETLRLAVRHRDGRCALLLTRPRSLDRVDPADLLHADRAGFSLKLVFGLAQIARSRIDADPGDVVLSMPLSG